MGHETEIRDSLKLKVQSSKMGMTNIHKNVIPKIAVAIFGDFIFLFKITLFRGSVRFKGSTAPVEPLNNF